MKNVLVTGGLGYIGSHTVIELVKAGYEPIIIDNLSNSTLSVLDQLQQITEKKLTFAEIEMCDKEQLEKIFQDHTIDFVIHFAAVLQVKESVENPVKYYHNNLFSTIHLLSLMKNYGVNSLVFSSSCTVYGNPDELPVTEEASVKPAVSPYGNTKKMCEDIIRDTTIAEPISCIALRYFNPIGAHESGKIGEVQHGEPHHLVPYITETAVGKRNHLKIFGNDYPTLDGTPVRDYIHVSDIARAHVDALHLLEKEEIEKYEVINLGSGTGFSVLQMVDAFESATGLKIPYELSERRSGDVAAVYADISKAKNKLGWIPKYSLKEMMQTAWRWETANAKY